MRVERFVNIIFGNNVNRCKPKITNRLKLTLKVIAPKISVVYRYVRVSTSKQSIEGKVFNHNTLQRQMIIKHCAEKGLLN